MRTLFLLLLGLRLAWSLDLVRECDDGNTKDGDGCSSIYTVEPGFDCTYSSLYRKSVCTCKHLVHASQGDKFVSQSAHPSTCKHIVSELQACQSSCVLPVGSCNRHTGACICQPGHAGSNCQTCEPNYHPLHAQDGSFLQCIACPTHKCSPHSTCQNSTAQSQRPDGSWDIRDTTCRCDPGWTGPACDQPLDQTSHHASRTACDRDACGPNSACDTFALQFGSGQVTPPDWQERDSSIQCRCKLGWTGNKCQVCKAGFVGPRCQPCMLCHRESQALCRDPVPGLTGTQDYMCVCKANRQGPFCSECAMGFVGPTCRSVCPACMHGDCHWDGGGGAFCVCKPGFHGVLCDMSD